MRKRYRTCLTLASLRSLPSPYGLETLRGDPFFTYIITLYRPKFRILFLAALVAARVSLGLSFPAFLPAARFAVSGRTADIAAPAVARAVCATRVHCRAYAAAFAGFIGRLGRHC